MYKCFYQFPWGIIYITYSRPILSVYYDEICQIHLHNYHHYQDIEYLHQPKKFPPEPLWSIPSPDPWPRQPEICYRLILPFRISYRVILYVIFHDWLSVLSITFLGLIYIVVSVVLSFSITVCQCLHTLQVSFWFA